MPKESVFAIRPARRFLCGLSLRSGVVCTLCIHAFASCGGLIWTWVNVYHKIPIVTMGLDVAFMIWVGVISMITIPFVMGGLLGVMTETEAPLRLYLVFLIFGYTVTIAGAVTIMLWRDACSALPPSLRMGEGAALACGWMRSMGVGACIGGSLVVLYAIFIVWSYCQAMKNGGANFDGFPILVRDLEKKKNKPSFAGLFGTNAPTLQGETPVFYGSLASPGVMGGVSIFGGRYHNTDYPHPASK